VGIHSYQNVGEHLGQGLSSVSRTSICLHSQNPHAKVQSLYVLFVLLEEFGDALLSECGHTLGSHLGPRMSSLHKTSICLHSQNPAGKGAIPKCFCFVFCPLTRIRACPPISDGQALRWMSSFIMQNLYLLAFSKPACKGSILKCFFVLSEECGHVLLSEYGRALGSTSELIT
jgi:hypothetical protein